MTWRRFSGEPLKRSLKEETERVIRREYALGNKLKACIGTDSQIKGINIDFATVIVFLREQRGGFMFIQQERSTYKMSVKERMLNEVQRSIECAYSVCKVLDRYQVALEVHADINTSPMFQSNQALHEAMGYILSMGFVFKAKPEAFASSACANRIVQ